MFQPKITFQASAIKVLLHIYGNCFNIEEMTNTKRFHNQDFHEKILYFQH